MLVPVQFECVRVCVWRACVFVHTCVKARVRENVCGSVSFLGLVQDEALPRCRRLALVQHVTQALRGRDKDCFFSMSMESNTLRTLSSVFKVNVAQPVGSDELGVSGPWPDFISVGGLFNAEHLSNRAKSLVFFTVTNAQLSRAHRTKVDGQQKLTNTALVCIHTLLKFTPSDKTCIASVAPMSSSRPSVDGSGGDACEPMALNPETLSSDTLQSMYVWHRKPDPGQPLVVTLPEADAALNTRLADATPAVLKLLSEHPAGLPAHDFGNPNELEVLQWLEGRDFVEGPPFRFTALGRASISVGVRLQEFGRLCNRKPYQVLDDFMGATLYELMLELDAEGFVYEEVSSKFARAVAKASPYLINAEVPDQTWYCAQGQPVCKWYPIALLNAKPDVQVPHLASSATYRTLLGIEQPKWRGKRRPSCAHAGAGSSFPDDFLETPGVKPRRKRAIPRKQGGGEASGGDGDEGSGASSAGSSRENGSVFEQESLDKDSSSDGDCGGDGPGGGDNVIDSDASSHASMPGLVSGSEKDDSSSSSSSDDEDDGGDGADDDAGADRLGQTFGHHLLTYRPPSRTKTEGAWQLTCCEPGHDGCTKTQNNAPIRGGSDGALRRLKQYAIPASDCADKTAHKAKWKQVMELWDNNRCLTMHELDAIMPSVFRPQKRRRL